MIMKRKTKEALVQEIYGSELTIDYALPHNWVQQWPTRFNPVPHFVWAYPRNSLNIHKFEFTYGLPAPLTIEGLRMIKEMGWTYHKPPSPFPETKEEV